MKNNEREETGVDKEFSDEIGSLAKIYGINIMAVYTKDIGKGYNVGGGFFPSGRGMRGQELKAIIDNFTGIVTDMMDEAIKEGLK